MISLSPSTQIRIDATTSAAKRRSSDEKTNETFKSALPLLKALSESPLNSKCISLVYDYVNKNEDLILVDEPHFILLDLPSGKPDPNAACRADTLTFDDRPRVDQPCVKENTCWYYAYNTIRHRIGKNSSAELASPRKIEHVVSMFRKIHTKHFSTLPTFYHECTEDDVEVVSKWNKQTVENKILPEWEKTYKEEYETTNFSTGATLLYDELLSFLNQNVHADFYSFMQEKLESPEMIFNEDFLNRFGIPPQKIFQAAQTILDPKNYQAFFKGRTWETLRAEDRSSLLNTYMAYSVAKLYKLEKSPWTPFDPIDSLIQNLRKSGPHVISLMVDFDEPMQLKRTVDGRPLFKWATFDEEKPPFGHMITLIGAEKKGKNGGGVVYYINPAEGSRSDTPRKIYTCSYKDLKYRIMNLISSINDDKTPSPAGYAWIRPLPPAA